MQNMAGRAPLDLSAVGAVYNIKSFSLAPVGAVQECYIPVDTTGCFGPDAPPDEQLIYWWGPRGRRALCCVFVCVAVTEHFKGTMLVVSGLRFWRLCAFGRPQRRPSRSHASRPGPCSDATFTATPTPAATHPIPPPKKRASPNPPASPYTFKDSLKNPWLRKVHVFHEIGLDRLVNTYRNPVLVTRPVTYESCPGTFHVSGGGGRGPVALGSGKAAPPSRPAARAFSAVQCPPVLASRPSARPLLHP
jgi:hypothetical protein